MSLFRQPETTPIWPSVWPVEKRTWRGSLSYFHNQCFCAWKRAIMGDHDLILARALQEEFDKELANVVSLDSEDDTPYQQNNPSTSRPLSVIDASWELTDPNPDARALFLQFNDQYFWGRLVGVEVKWSPRMTSWVCHSVAGSHL